MSTTILDRIKAYKLEEIKADKSKREQSDVEEDAKTAAPVRPSRLQTWKSLDTPVKANYIYIYIS